MVRLSRSVGAGVWMLPSCCLFRLLPHVFASISCGVWELWWVGMRMPLIGSDVGMLGLSLVELFGKD